MLEVLKKLRVTTLLMDQVHFEVCLSWFSELTIVYYTIVKVGGFAIVQLVFKLLRELPEKLISSKLFRFFKSKTPTDLSPILGFVLWHRSRRTSIFFYPFGSNVSAQIEYEEQRIKMSNCPSRSRQLNRTVRHFCRICFYISRHPIKTERT